MIVHLYRYVYVHLYKPDIHLLLCLSVCNYTFNPAQVMAEVSVPSTLVKCLYLFFDLPEMSEDEANNTDINSDFTPRERRILLQKIFVQLLVRLCSHRSSAEELARKDDLTLLFSAITSWCPAHNGMWRKSAAEVLMTLSRHGLTPPVVSYIHSECQLTESNPNGMDNII